MNPKIKVCGITRLEDARFCAAAGADFLGFIQHEKSPRFIASHRVRAITEWIHGPVPVGVFVDAAADRVREAIDEAGFEMVQLHGNETPVYCLQFDVPVIKAIRIRPGDRSSDVGARASTYADAVDYLLFDTYDPHVEGGTGRPFDWRLLAEAVIPLPFFVAGGVTSSNVGRVIPTVKPFGVDLSSSLESSPGIKDPDKLDAFFAAVAQSGKATDVP